jgi:syndecan 1
MQSILQAAEDEAAEIRKKAHAAARVEQETVRAQLADMVRQRDAVLAELTRMRGQLEGLLAAPTARITLPPREGAPAPAARQRDGSGAPKSGPAQASPAGRPASGARPAPSPAPAGRSAGASPAEGGPARPDQGGSSRPPGGPAPSGSAAPGGPGGGGPPANRPALPDAPPGPKSEPAAAQGDARNPSPAAARGESGANASSGADRGSSSSQGKTAAHRLPTGGYQVVASSVEQSGSMRPSTEPEPEPGDLFRPVAGRPGDEPQGPERTTAVQGVPPPDKSGTAPGTDGKGRTTGPVDSTVKVNSVRPPGGQDAGRFGSPPGAVPNRGEQKNPRSDEAKDGLRGDGGPGGAGGSDRSGRSPSASRSG